MSYEIVNDKTVHVSWFDDFISQFYGATELSFPLHIDSQSLCVSVSSARDAVCCVFVTSRPTQRELEAITMNPIRMTSDLDWLESHVRGVCGGELPPLVGPYAVPFLVAQLDGMRKHFIDGGADSTS